MKKFKIIPVLAVSMLLTACQTGVKVSKPKFAAEGTSMQLEDYEKAIDEAFKASEWGKEDLKVGSKEMKSVSSSETLKVKKLNGKEIYKDDEKSSIQGQMQGDAENNVIVSKSVEKGERKRTTQEGKYSNSSSAKSQQTLQAGTVKVGDKDVEGVIQTNDITKQYVLMGAFDEDVTKDNWYTSQFVGIVTSLSMMFEYYALPSYIATDEEKAKFSYFQNDKVFTTKYVDAPAEPKETKTTIGDKEYVLSKTTTKVEKTIQLDLTDGKMAFRYSIENTTTIEYLENYSQSDESKGTVVTTESKQYADMSLVDKKVSLKPVDLAKYEYIDFIG